MSDESSDATDEKRTRPDSPNTADENGTHNESSNTADENGTRTGPSAPADRNRTRTRSPDSTDGQTLRAATDGGGQTRRVPDDGVGSRYRTAARFPTALLARRNVSRAKLRSALAAAAIAIGVFAVATVGATGVAFKSQQVGAVESFGVGQVLLFPGPDADSRFTSADVGRIEEAVGEFGVVATSAERVDLIDRGRRTTATATFIEDPRAQFAIGEGSLPPPANWDRTAVVSAEFAAEEGLSAGDRITLVRERATPRGTEEYERTYRVAAILEPSDAFTKTPIYLPLEETQDEQFDRVLVTTGSASEATIAADRIDEAFNGRKDRVTILEFTAIIELLGTITDGINRLLLLLGAVSMVVAAIAIANTMLMATIRRREEIGVLRAVGYQKNDILRVLLAEAAIIGCVGGFVGAAAATVGTAFANALLGGELFAFSSSAALAFSPTQIAYIVGGVAFGILVSLVAGFYPAWRAANERPVEALRG